MKRTRHIKIGFKNKITLSQNKTKIFLVNTISIYVKVY